MRNVYKEKFIGCPTDVCEIKWRERCDSTEESDDKCGLCWKRFAEYLLSEEAVDWKSVDVDTKILVREREADDWIRAYYAGFNEIANCVIAWADGSTSYSARATETWRYAKLHDEAHGDD